MELQRWWVAPWGESDGGVNRRGRQPWVPLASTWGVRKNTCLCRCCRTSDGLRVYLRSLPVISSLASSARPVIACDWPHLSLAVEASIRVGGAEESRPLWLISCIWPCSDASPPRSSGTFPLHVWEQSRNWDNQGGRKDEYLERGKRQMMRWLSRMRELRCWIWPIAVAVAFRRFLVKKDFKIPKNLLDITLNAKVWVCKSPTKILTLPVQIPNLAVSQITTSCANPGPLALLLRNQSVELLRPVPETVHPSQRL